MIEEGETYSKAYLRFEGYTLEGLITVFNEAVFVSIEDYIIAVRVALDTYKVIEIIDAEEVNRVMKSIDGAN